MIGKPTLLWARNNDAAIVDVAVSRQDMNTKLSHAGPAGIVRVRQALAGVAFRLKSC
jgi:hypothetical protein